MKKPVVLLSFCLILFSGTASGLEKRSSKKECTLCHILWLEAFGGGKETLWEEKEAAIVVSGSRSVVTTREMCYSCHDGYVADSRMWIAEGNKHHSLKKVPEGLELPKNFRLDMNNEFYCGTCHGFHDITAEGKIGEVPFLRLPDERSQMCLACHEDQGELQKRKNHPVLVKLKDDPSPELEKRRAKLGPEGEVICQSCHAPHASEVAIATVEESKLCLFCHADKQTHGSPLASGRWLHPVNVKPDRDLREVAGLPEGARLGAGGWLICSTCHSTHRGRGLSLLVQRDTSTFCNGCHQKEVKAISGTKHDLSRTAAKSRNLHGESPQQSGICRTCHLAHGWAQETPGPTDTISGACLS
jgi:predicted CXXCH cytochrome family protein